MVLQQLHHIFGNTPTLAESAAKVAELLPKLRQVSIDYNLAKSLHASLQNAYPKLQELHIEYTKNKFADKAKLMEEFQRVAKPIVGQEYELINVNTRLINQKLGQMITDLRELVDITLHLQRTRVIYPKRAKDIILEIEQYIKFTNDLKDLAKKTYALISRYLSSGGAKI